METTALSRVDSQLLQLEPSRGTTGAGFSDELANAIRSVEGLQLEADEQATRVALGGGNLHETAIALEKADIAMRVATKVRNKVVEAYQEVMRMNL